MKCPILKAKQIEKEVTAWGNGGGMLLPKSWIGRKVLAILLED
jgi:putative transposon-encoded protein